MIAPIRRRPAPDRRRPSRRLDLAPVDLEARQVMAVAAALVDGVLTVNADAPTDRVEIKWEDRRGPRVKVEWFVAGNEIERRFNAALVDTIVLSGPGAFDVDDDLPLPFRFDDAGIDPTPDPTPNPVPVPGATAPTFVLAGGTLTVTGTAATDSVEVQRRNGRIKVEVLTGATEVERTFPVAQVTSVRYVGNGGNDRVEIRRGLGVPVDAEAATLTVSGRDRDDSPDDDNGRNRRRRGRGR